MQNAQTNLPKPGQRIYATSGFSDYRDGIALAHINDRFGTYALILFDNGSTDTCHGLRTSPGIGWHSGPSPELLWTRRNAKKAN